MRDRNEVKRETRHLQYNCIDMIRGKRNKIERTLLSSSRHHPTASTRRRRLEGANQPLDVPKAVDPSISDGSLSGEPKNPSTSTTKTNLTIKRNYNYLLLFGVLL